MGGPAGPGRRAAVLAAVLLVGTGLLVFVRGRVRHGRHRSASAADPPATTAGTDRPGGR